MNNKEIPPAYSRRDFYFNFIPMLTQTQANTLHNYWQQLLQPYTDNQALVEDGYQMITVRYREPHRHYHTLQHLENLLQLQQTYSDRITDNETVSFAIYFHDIVYDVKQPDNEEQSALAAHAFLQQTSYPAERIAQVMAFIRATKTHLNISNNTDLDYFLDFDLSILGTPSGEYLTYTKQIRDEYHMYPDAQFYSGREKVLMHFLALPAIYKTAVFREEREAIARENLGEELRIVSRLQVRPPSR